jgi:DNA-binding Lrp family transcriptional regulator
VTPFARIPYKILKRHDLNSTEKNIISYLYGQKKLHPDGKIRTTSAIIAAAVAKSVRWVKECIKHLKSKGLILVKRGRYCFYSIVHKGSPLKKSTFYNIKNDSGGKKPDANEHQYLNEVMRKIPFKARISRRLVNNWLFKHDGDRSYIFWLIKIALKKRNSVKYFMKGLKKYYAAYLRSEDFIVAGAIAEFKSMGRI